MTARLPGTSRDLCEILFLTAQNDENHFQFYKALAEADEAIKLDPLDVHYVIFESSVLQYYFGRTAEALNLLAYKAVGENSDAIHYAKMAETELNKKIELRLYPEMIRSHRIIANAYCNYTLYQIYIDLAAAHRVHGDRDMEKYYFNLAHGASKFLNSMEIARLNETEANIKKNYSFNSCHKIIRLGY
jgi:tetratricopeptide (TPR) repeat protein